MGVGGQEAVGLGELFIAGRRCADVVDVRALLDLDAVGASVQPTK